MNILQVHNKYKIRGGEWTVLNQEYELLKKNHQVQQYIADNSEKLNGFASKLKVALSTHYNRNAKKRMLDYLVQSRPDVMHVHNFFPLLSPSIFDAARQKGIPSVLTMHNYRLMHPNGLLYHNGKIDRRSIEGSAYQCVMDGVYRNSRFQTAVTAHMIEFHRKKRTWHRVPSAFIALSEFSKQTFIEGGLPGERIFVKPNFLEDPLENSGVDIRKNSDDNTVIYAGRMSNEKGVQDLVHCWLKHKPNVKLLMAGDGPLKNQLIEKSAGNPNIVWAGNLDRNELLAAFAKSIAFIFPTKWYEGQPMVLLESLAMGCPVITSRIGNPMDIIEDGITGLHFTPGDIDNLNEKVSLLIQNGNLRNKMSENARNRYLQSYTPEQNYKKLMEIYDMADELEKSLQAS